MILSSLPPMLVSFPPPPFFKFTRGKPFNINMLTSLLIIPVLGVIALSPMQDGSAADNSRMKKIALFVTLLNFVVSLVM